MDDVSAAKILIKSLDLTSLNSTDTEETIKDLCSRSQTNDGNTAAVCIYPQFLLLAKSALPSTTKIATVINFPSGLADLNLLEKEISSAIIFGADELDIVFPYRTFLNNDIEFCDRYLKIARNLCNKKILKIIIESGELKTVNNIKTVSKLCIENQVDFIKTSTGKSEISATPEAANIILETIKQSDTNTGFKASGGIKTLNDAKKYLTLAQSIMGPTWINSSHFRIGASSVLTDLLETINRGY